jgi:hypothetical protein
VSQTCIFDTKRTNDDFQVAPQTTPAPLSDRRRCAALPLLISGGELEKGPICTANLLAHGRRDWLPSRSFEAAKTDWSV